MWKTGTSVAGLLVFIAVGVSSAASQAASPGNHIHPAEGVELVPSLELAGVRRSNVYLAEGLEKGDSEPVSGFSFNVVPRFGLTAKNPKLNLGLDSQYTIRWYPNSELSNLNRFRDVQLSLNVDALPSGLVGVRLRESFAITGFEVDSAADSENAYVQRTGNTIGGELVVRPGSSLEVEAGVSGDFADYRSLDPDVSDSGLNTKSSIAPTLGVSWRFLPKTSLLVDGSYTIYDWEINLLDVTGGGEAVDPLVGVGNAIGVPDGQALRVQVGLTGQFTAKVAGRAMIGYAGFRFDEDSVLDSAAGVDIDPVELDPASAGFAQDINGLLVNLEGNWKPEDTQVVTLGYRRDFREVYFTDVMAVHNPYIRYSGTYIEKLTTDVSLDFRSEAYRGEVERTDWVTRPGLRVSWIFFPWMSGSLGTSLVARRSQDEASQDVDYTDSTIFGSLTFTY
jgi:hypothetical protein